MADKIELGATVRDTITSYKGVATGRTEYLHEAPEVRVTPQALDGRSQPVQSHWFPEARLVRIISEGQRVRDKATGFEGIVIDSRKALHPADPPEFCVQPGSSRAEARWFSEQHLELLEQKAKPSS
jgi:heat shock protein HspQ